MEIVLFGVSLNNWRPILDLWAAVHFPGELRSNQCDSAGKRENEYSPHVARGL